MGALIFFIAIAITAVVFYLYLQKLFSDGITKEMTKPKDATIPLSKAAMEEGESLETLSSREPEKIFPDINMGHKIEPGINDPSYQEIIMAPSYKNIYQAEDYFEGSPEDDRTD